MVAKEQLTAMEMIWGFMSGTTGHMGKTDFAPQKEAFGDFASPETYFPRVTPESEGISSEKLTQMLRELAAARHTDMHHLLVLRNGHVICECNFAPYRSGIWHATYSMCKSITGMAAGFLISEGKLSLDENVYDIFEKRNGLLQKILRPNLTVKHLLTMKSGVQFNEMGVVSGNDWVDSFLNAPVKGTPGEAFEYNSMNTYLLSAIIQERTGMKMVDYLRPRLFEPLGIRKVFWESCPAGITKGGWGLFLCPEDAAKLGVMYVNGGKFEGKQIVPAEWVAASTSVHATPPEKMGKYGYGYQVWMEERPGSFAFNGMLGQNVLGYPDTGVVIDWKNEHSECVSALASGAATIALLPQPFVTVAESKMPELRTALDLTEQWDALDNGSALITGVVVARRDVVEAHPQAVERFLEQYAASVDWVNANTADAAALIGEYGIVDAAVAEKALPACNIVCITGSEMKEKLSGYLQVLCDASADSVGGAMPGDDFYYGAE